MELRAAAAVRIASRLRRPRYWQRCHRQRQYRYETCQRRSSELLYAIDLVFSIKQANTCEISTRNIQIM